MIWDLDDGRFFHSRKGSSSVAYHERPFFLAQFSFNVRMILSKFTHCQKWHAVPHHHIDLLTSCDARADVRSLAQLITIPRLALAPSQEFWQPGRRDTANAGSAYQSRVYKPNSLFQTYTNQENMPILQQYSLPDSLDDLKVPEGTESGFFIAFLASEDPATRKPWCPDVVAALPVLKKTFSAESTPVVAFVEVGQKPEYVAY